MKYATFALPVSLIALYTQAFAAECWQQRAALLDWDKQEYSRPVAELRVSTLKQIQQFQKECKVEIKTFPAVKKIIANAPTELADAEARLSKMQEVDQKRQSNDCKSIALKRQYCGLAVSYRNIELHTISGSENQIISLRKIDRQMIVLSKQISESSGNQIAKSYCEVIDKPLTGSQVIAIARRPSTQDIEQACGK